MENQNEFNEELFAQKIFSERYSMIKRQQIREAVDKYKAESNDDSRYFVLKSNVREDKKAKELYSLSKSFNSWKDAESYSSSVTHSIIVDTETKSEIKNKNE